MSRNDSIHRFEECAIWPVQHEVIGSCGGTADEDLVTLFLEPEEWVEGIENFGGVADREQDFPNG